MRIVVIPIVVTTGFYCNKENKEIDIEIVFVV